MVLPLAEAINAIRIRNDFMACSTRTLDEYSVQLFVTYLQTLIIVCLN